MSTHTIRNQRKASSGFAPVAKERQRLYALVFVGATGVSVLLGATGCGSTKGALGGNGGKGTVVTPEVGTSGMGGAPGAGEPSGAGAGSMESGNAGEASGGEAGAAGGDTGDGIDGMVVARSTQLPLADRTVRIGTRQTVTDSGGHFVLPRPASLYDVEIIDPGGASISVYRNLGGAAPMLVHEPFDPQPVTRFARLNGKASGSLAFPIPPASSGVLSVYLLSDLGNSRAVLGGGAPPYGPDYSSSLAWNGGASLSAQLFALATFPPAAPAAGGAAYAAAAMSKAVDLHDGATATQDVVLDDVRVGVLSGTASLPPGVEHSRFEQFYRFAQPGALCDFPDANVVGAHSAPSPTGFTFDLPDLTALGGQLCTSVISTDAGNLRTERCGLSLDAAPVTLDLKPAVTLLMPGAGSAVSPETPVSWSPNTRVVYDVVFEPDEASAATPTVHVFTAANEATLPSLKATVMTPLAGSAYQLSIGALGPFDSLEDAAAPTGLAAPIRPESWSSYSSPMPILVSD